MHTHSHTYIYIYVWLYPYNMYTHTYNFIQWHYNVYVGTLHRRKTHIATPLLSELFQLPINVYTHIIIHKQDETAVNSHFLFIYIYIYVSTRLAPVNLQLIYILLCPLPPPALKTCLYEFSRVAAVVRLSYVWKCILLRNFFDSIPYVDTSNGSNHRLPRDKFCNTRAIFLLYETH